MSTLFEQAVELEASGEIVGATFIYEQILSKDARAAVNLGTICFNRKEFGRAVTLYRQATKIAPDYALAWFDLGNALDETGEFAKAITACQTAICLEPQYADAHYNLALAHEHQKEPRKAIKHWRTYVKLDAAGPWADHARRAIRKTIEADCLSIVWRRDAA